MGLRDAGWACKHKVGISKMHHRDKVSAWIFPAFAPSTARKVCIKIDTGLRKCLWVMAMLEWKQCLLCGKRFLGSVKRKFCSKQCRIKFHKRLNAIRRMMRDPQFKQRSLARLLAWKERKKREKQAQEQAEKNQRW